MPGHLDWVHRELVARADAATAAWWQGYVKNAAPFLGVPMADVRRIVARLVDSRLGDLQADGEAGADARDLAFALLARPASEEKLAGTLLLAERLIPRGICSGPGDLDRMESALRAGHLADWNVVDWFSVKVTGQLLEREGRPTARRLATWRTHPELWVARASLVPFTRVAGDPRFHRTAITIARTLLRREERFAKTAVGWVLREVSSHDPALVERFVAKEIAHFSAESLRNAVKRLEPSVRSALLAARRECR